jgi:uncharacterized protein (DUF2237 family)
MITCSLKPFDRFFYRNGCCDSEADDTGEHTVCIQATKESWLTVKVREIDLSHSPIPGI